MATPAVSSSAAAPPAPATRGSVLLEPDEVSAAGVRWSGAVTTVVAALLSGAGDGDRSAGAVVVRGLCGAFRVAVAVARAGDEVVGAAAPPPPLALGKTTSEHE
jgi:hypothetical protein